jgi:hypothetical protein
VSHAQGAVLVAMTALAVLRVAGVAPMVDALLLVAAAPVALHTGLGLRRREIELVLHRLGGGVLPAERSALGLVLSEQPVAVVIHDGAVQPVVVEARNSVVEPVVVPDLVVEAATGAVVVIRLIPVERRVEVEVMVDLRRRAAQLGIGVILVRLGLLRLGLLLGDELQQSFLDRQVAPPTAHVARGRPEGHLGGGQISSLPGVDFSDFG